MTLYSQDGWTALHMASQEGHVDVVCALIDANARVNQQTTLLDVSIAKLAVFICSDRQCPHTLSVYPSSVHFCSIPFASLPALPSPPVLSFYPSITMSHYPSSVPPQIHPPSFPSSCPPTLPSFLSAKTQKRSTALYLASMKGHVAVVQLLLQRHADVSICQAV